MNPRPNVQDKGAIQNQAKQLKINNIKDFTMTKEQLGYEAPTVQTFEVRFEGAILTGSNWDANNNTENLFDDGTIIGL